MGVRAIAEADSKEPLCTQSLNIRRAVFDVDVSTNLLFLLHETEIPVGNPMVVEPVNGLAYGGPVKVVNEQPVRDDPNSRAFVGEPPQIVSRTVNHRGTFKQSTLGYCKSVQAFVVFSFLDPPLLQPVGDFWRQIINLTLEPLGSYLAHSPVKI